MPRAADPARRGAAARCLSVAALLMATGPFHVRAMLVAAPVHPYELGFREAAIVVQGNIVAYDAALGAMLRVRRVVRGDVPTGADYRLSGSASYSFLAALPGDVTAFIAGRDGQALRLWHGPTSGGLIWSEPGLLERIERAHADPTAALRATDPRERLAAAYYLTAVRSAGTDPARRPRAEMDSLVDSVAWGLTNGSPSTHQAAVDTLAALGHRLDALGIAYHPLFKPELKADAARKLRAWWATQR